MTADIQPWKAAPDVFVVTQPAAAFVEALRRAAASLTFESADPDCRFFSHAGVTETESGPAVVLTNVAEYATGVRHSAVVVSAAVREEPGQGPGSGERLVVIRTHLEDQHTRHEGERIVYEAHHDTMRGALVEAVRSIEPDAVHRSRPVAPSAPADGLRARQRQAEGPSVERAQRRTEPVAVAATAPRVDVRQLAGIAALVLGVVILLLSIAFGSLSTVVGAVGVAGLLGYVGNRISGA